MLNIKRHKGPTPPVDRLLVESMNEGHRFISRLVRDWESGKNSFARPGEAFFLAWMDKDVVAVGGLNVDPYSRDESVGRVRHVYVSPEFRRRGIGRSLVLEIIDAAKRRFQQIRLRTDTHEGDCFYLELGFERVVESGEATHCLRLASDRVALH